MAKKNVATGMPNTSPAASQANSLGIRPPGCGRNCNAMPWAIDMVPMVIMNGETLRRVTPSPLKSPATTPMDAPAAIAHGMAAGLRSATCDITTTTTAATAPTDMSMPAVSMTKVWPTLMIPSAVA